MTKAGTVGAAMRGASATALRELGEKAASTHGLDDAGAVGEQLFAVAGVLRDEPALRRVLADASVEGPAKSGLASSVFAGSLREDTLALVTDAVQRRWTTPSDLVSAFDELAVICVVRSAGAAGRTLSDEIFAVRQVVRDNPELRSALSDVSRSSADRVALLHDLLGHQVQGATLRLVDQAVTSPGNVDNTLAAYQKLAASVQGETVAVVRSARPLTEADQQRLVAALGKQYDTHVHLHVVVEPALVGGLRVEIGDDVIDGTVANRLDDARRRLVG